MPQQKPTDVAQFMQEIGAGVFEEQLSHILSDLARAVTARSRKGELAMRFTFTPIPNTEQVQIDAHWSFKKPKTGKGNKSEDEHSVTVMYVNSDNTVTLFAKNQTDLIGLNPEMLEE